MNEYEKMIHIDAYEQMQLILRRLQITDVDGLLEDQLHEAYKRIGTLQKQAAVGVAFLSAIEATELFK